MATARAEVIEEVGGPPPPPGGGGGAARTAADEAANLAAATAASLANTSRAEFNAAREDAKRDTAAEFNYIEIPGDGNCLFEAIARAMGGGYTAKWVRNLVVARLRDKCKENDAIIHAMRTGYADLITMGGGIAQAESEVGEETPADTVCTSYTKKMAINRVYGGHLEIVAASNIFARPIHVYARAPDGTFKKNDTYSVSDPTYVNESPINLVWLNKTPQHYDLLVPKAALPSDDASAAAASGKATIRTLYTAIAPIVLGADAPADADAAANAVVAAVKANIPPVCAARNKAATNLIEACGGDPTTTLDTDLEEAKIANIILLAKTFNREIYVFVVRADGRISIVGGSIILPYYQKAGLSGEPIYLEFTGKTHTLLDSTVGKRLLMTFFTPVSSLYEAVARSLSISKDATGVLTDINKAVTLTCPGDEGGSRDCTIDDAVGGIGNHLNYLIVPRDFIILFALSKTYKRPVYAAAYVDGKYVTVGDTAELSEIYTAAGDITGDPLYFKLEGGTTRSLTAAEFDALGAISPSTGGSVAGGDGAAKSTAGSVAGGDEELLASLFEPEDGPKPVRRTRAQQQEDYSALAAALFLEAAAAAAEQEERIRTGVAVRRPGTAMEQLSAVASAGKGAFGMMATPFKRAAAGAAAGLSGIGSRLKGLVGKSVTGAGAAGTPMPKGTPFVAPTLPDTYPPEVKKLLAKVAEKPVIAVTAPPMAAAAVAAEAPKVDDATAAIHTAATAALATDKVAAAAITDKTKDSVAPVIVADGSVTGVYIVWKDNILIHQRGETLTPAKVISTPGGAVGTGKAWKEEAKRELAEEAQFTVGGAELTDEQLLAFRTLTLGDGKTLQFFRVQLEDAAKPEVKGPATGHEAEVMKLDANVLALPGLDAGVPTYRWVHRGELERWLSRPLSLPYRDELFYTNLQVLNALLGEPKTKVAPAPEANHLPVWVPKTYFSEADYQKAIGKCGDVSFITQDCLERAVLDDIFRGKDYAENRRLAKRDDAMLVRYNELAAKQKALKEAPEQTVESNKELTSVESQLKANYYDEQVIIRNPATKVETVYKVPNPYRALAYREKDPAGPVNFAGAPVASEFDPEGAMRAANMNLLKALAPTEMIADHGMAVALLESLWFCGRNPTVSNDPRCFPARLLGELREWRANQEQMANKERVAAMLNSSSWPALKIMVDGLMRASRTTPAFPFVPLPPAKKEEKVGAAPVTPPTGTGTGTGTSGNDSAALAAAAAAEEERKRAEAAMAAAKPGGGTPGGGTPPPRGTIPALSAVPIRPLTGTTLRPLMPVPLGVPVAAK